MSETKSAKLTKAMEAALHYLVKKTSVTKPMIDAAGPHLGSYEALFNRGLADRPPMNCGPYTITDLGRNHPAAKG